MRNTPVNEV